MANESETVMAVCAEWRDCIEAADPSVWNDERIAGLVATTKAQQLAYLDRIEAAWKREREELREAATEKMLEGATIIDNRGHGNAAALREALVKIRRELNDYCNGCTLIDRMTEDPPDYTCLRDSLLEIGRIVDAALSAPPRNCDVGTAEEQIERLYGGETCPSCKSPQMTSDGCACVREGPCALRWAQMPYEAKEKGDCDGE